MKQRTRLTSIFLALVLIVLSLPLSVGAVDPTMVAQSSDGEDMTTITAVGDSATAVAQGPASWAELGIGEKTLEELRTMTLDYSTVPELISIEQAEQKGHVNRLKAQETSLNVVTFQNRDGNKSSYVFSKPIKYRSAEGEVRDKSTVLTAQANQYAMLDNSVKAYFPNTLSQGVRVEYEDYQILMTPVTTASATLPMNENNMVAYGNAFGAATILSYQAQLDGIKEDIVVVKNTSIYSYSFTLTLTNTTPICIDGVWYLKDSDDRVIADFGRVIIKDDNGKKTEGTMQITPSGVANTYTLTVTAPQDYMNASDTVYPVYIDPTVTVYEWDTWITTNSEGETVYIDYRTIDDVGVYSTWDSCYVMGETNLHRVGSFADGEGFLVYRLTDFIYEGHQFYNLKYHQIGKVTLYFTLDTTVNPNPATDLTAYPITDSATAADFNHPISCFELSMMENCYDPSMPKTPTLSVNDIFALDITDYARLWAKYNAGLNNVYAPDQGLIICNNSDTNYCDIASTLASGYNNAYYQIDYTSTSGEYYIYNNYDFEVLLGEEMVAGHFLQVPSTPNDDNTVDAVHTLYLQNDNTSVNHKFVFEYIGDNEYVIRSVLHPNYLLGHYKQYRSSSCSADESVTCVCQGHGWRYCTQFEYVSSFNNLAEEYKWKLDSASGKYYIKKEINTDTVNCKDDSYSATELTECRTLYCNITDDYSLFDTRADGRSMTLVGDTSGYESELLLFYLAPVPEDNSGIGFNALDSFEITGTGWVNSRTCSHNHANYPDCGILCSACASCDSCKKGKTQLSVKTDPAIVTLYHDNRFFTWSSDNPSVATVSPNGVIAAGAAGVATITATHKATISAGNSHEILCVSATFHIVVGQIFPEGTYYIMNKEAGKYLELKNGSTALNAGLDVNNYHGGAHSQWTLSYYGEGYYYIKSANGYKMGVKDSYTSNQANVCMVANADSSTRWKITKTATGAFRLTAQCGEENDRCLGLFQYSYSDAIHCGQITYTDDTDYSDEWYITYTNRIVDLVIEYDQKYLNKYLEDSGVDLTDLTLTFEHHFQLANRILNDMSVVREKYAEYYYTNLVYTVNIGFFASTLDNCTCGDGHCTHKDIDNIETQLFALKNRDSNKKYLYLVGASFASKNAINGNGYVNGPLGSTWQLSGFCTVSYILDDSKRIKTNLHEVGHLIYAPDHYGEGTPTTDAIIAANPTIGGFDEKCIYGEERHDLPNHLSLQVCAGCRAIVDNYLNS